MGRITARGVLLSFFVDKSCLNGRPFCPSLIYVLLIFIINSEFSPYLFYKVRQQSSVVLTTQHFRDFGSGLGSFPYPHCRRGGNSRRPVHVVSPDPDVGTRVSGTYVVPPSRRLNLLRSPKFF